MPENLKNLIAEWRKSLSQAVVTWYKAHFKAACSLCHTPTLLKDLNDFKRLRVTFQICPDCCNNPVKLNRFLYSCDICQNVFPKGALTEFRDKLLCRECLGERSFCCPECHDRVSWNKKFVTQSTVEICKPCAEKFKLHGPLFSGEAKAVLEKCHRAAVKKRRTGRGEESLCRTQGVIIATCGGCGKRVPVDQLSEIDNSLLCRKCLAARFSLCPICGTRITADNSFYSTYLLEYCNPCGKKSGLTRYIPPEDTAETKQRSSGIKGRKKKTERTVEYQAELISSPDDLRPGMVDMQTLTTMWSGKRTSQRELSPTHPSKPAFSRKNYYHPEFDDNLPDDFVVDGIGGLDDKHDV